MKLNSILNVFSFQRSDSRIDWKELKFGENHTDFSTTTVVNVHTSKRAFKPGFRPSMSFRTSNWYAYKLYRQTFVSQVLVNDPEDYEREYISLRFKAGIHDITNDTKDNTDYTDWGYTDLIWEVAKTSKGEHLIIGCSGYFKFRNLSTETLIVFFQVDDSIHYRYKNATYETVLNLDQDVYVFLNTWYSCNNENNVNFSVDV